MNGRINYNPPDFKFIIVRFQSFDRRPSQIKIAESPGNDRYLLSEFRTRNILSSLTLSQSSGTGKGPCHLPVYHGATAPDCVVSVVKLIGDNVDVRATIISFSVSAKASSAGQNLLFQCIGSIIPSPSCL